MVKDNTLLKPLDFCTVVSKKLADHGLVQGEEVLVAATRALPAKKSDPYLQRIYVLCNKIVDGEVLIPKEGDDVAMNYLVDPRSLEKVSEERGIELLTALNAQFGNAEDKEVEDATIN
ncbi:MAG: hypothetical protein GQ574_14715 [Crocinitomix sp.]|nr:hypothetical protein [Crocinitomix sp.]